MKKLIVLALFVVIGYMAWKLINGDGDGPKLKALYQEPYVIVYGQEECKWTQNYLQRLKSAGVNYFYKEFAKPETDNELVPRLREAGVDMTSLPLPVIDVNGRMRVRPRMKEIFSLYNKGVSASADPVTKNVPIPEEPPMNDQEVTVFGRDSCSLTQKALGQLQDAGIAYVYKVVDQFEAEEELYWRMKQARLNMEGFYYPVIAAKGQVYVSPKMAEIIPLLRSK